jgi:hypothetical protein
MGPTEWKDREYDIYNANYWHNELVSDLMADTSIQDEIRQADDAFLKSMGIQAL